MIVAPLAAMRMVDRRGYWLVLLIPFMALPTRGLVAASLITGWGGRLAQGLGYRPTFMILGAPAPAAA